MTAKEFSDSFDALVSSFDIKALFGDEVAPTDIAFDEYEKSLFLTKAQEETVVSLYNGNTSSGESFESTEEQRRYLSNLVKEASLSPTTNTSGFVLGMGSNSKFFTLPQDLWYITYESVNIDNAKCDAYNPMDVYPVTQDDYNKTKRNPFRGTNDRRALRLDLADGVIEIICKYNVTKYYVRYLRKPKPIILIDLPDGLTINGESKTSVYGDNKDACELHTALHKRILDRAVLEAIQSKVNTNTTTNNK